MQRILAVLVLLICPVTVRAQKAPELGYVYPPVVPAGATTRVVLGGYDFTPDMQLFVHDDRCRIQLLGAPGEFIIPPPPYWFGEKGSSPAFPIPREIPAEVTIPADFPPGPVRWQVANANGGSTTAVFLVSDGPEHLEERDRDRPQVIQSLPVSISGRLSRITEIDRYRVTADRDGPMTVELFARRLGADFNGVIEVRDATGKAIADAADTEGRDTAVTFRAISGGEYLVSLHDVDFRGNRAFVYRLSITPGPRVVATLPSSVTASATQPVTFIGPGVETGSAKPEMTTRALSVPADPAGELYRYRLETPHGTSPLIDLPLRAEAEIDDPFRAVERIRANASSESQPVARGQRRVEAATEPVALEGPGVFTSLMDSTGTAAWTWQAAQGEFWSIRAESRALGTGLDLSLTILDAEGRQLAANDDLPNTTDAGLEFKVPADGVYRCVLSDLSGSSGRLTAAYRIAFRKSTPDFRLSVPQTVNLPIGGKTSVQINVERLGGLNDPIAIQFTGLPAGVSATGELTVPAGKSVLKATLEAAADAPALAAFFGVEGTSIPANPESGSAAAVIHREATAIAAGNLCPRAEHDTAVTRLLLATTLTPKFSVELVDKNRQRAVHRGTTYPAPFQIRREADFSGEVLLQMAARQGRHRQGIHGPVLTVPADADEALYPCFMPEWLATDRTTRMVVLGVARQPDPAGRLRYVTRPADARITMILEGALLKVEQAAGELSVPLGQPFEVPVHVSRSAKLQTSVTLTLAVPEELQGLVSLEEHDVSLPSTTSDTILRVRTGGAANLAGRWTIQIQAHALQDERWPVMSQTDLTLDLLTADPTEAAAGSE